MRCDLSCSRFTRDQTSDDASSGGDVDDDDKVLFGYNRYGWLPLPQLTAYFGGGSKSEKKKTKEAAAVVGWSDTNIGLLMQVSGWVVVVDNSNFDLTTCHLLALLSLLLLSLLLLCLLFRSSFACSCSQIPMSPRGAGSQQ